MGEDRHRGVSREIKFTSDPPSGLMRLHCTWEFLREEGKMGRRFGGSLWVLSAQEKEAAMDAIEVALKMLKSGKFRWGGISHLNLSGFPEKSSLPAKTRVRFP